MQPKDERLVVLLVDNSVSFTGALKCALQQARLMQDGYRYEFVLPAGSTAASFILNGGMPVHTLPMVEIRKHWLALLKYPFALVQNAFRLNGLIQSRRVQVLIINDYYNLLGAAVRLLNKKVRIVTHVRLQPAGMPPLLSWWWAAAALRCSDLVIAVSKTVQRQLPTHHKVRLLYDAVAFTEKHPEKAEKKASGTVSLLYLGNYIRGKGHDHALKAFAGAYPQNPYLRLLFYGGDMGLQKNRQFKKELEAFAANNNLAEVVSFHPFVQDVERVYREADVFLNFSEAESFSMTCAEAAFYGLPVIASRCGGPEEIVVHKKTGVLVANKDISGMQAAILLLADDGDMRKAFGTAGAKYVRKRFGTERYVQQLSTLFHDLRNTKYPL